MNDGGHCGMKQKCSCTTGVLVNSSEGTWKSLSGFKIYNVVKFAFENEKENSGKNQPLYDPLHTL